LSWSRRPPKILNSGVKVLDQKDQLQRMSRRAFKAELQVPRYSAVVDSVNKQGTYSDHLAGPQDTSHRVQQQRTAQMLALSANIDCQASEQDDGHRLVGCQAPCEPRASVTRHHRPSRERVVADNVQPLLSGYEHTCATAAMTLKGVLAQPCVERQHATAEAIGAVPRIYGNGLLKAHELVVEHAGRRQQARELGKRASGPIQHLDELIPGVLVESKRAAIRKRVLRNDPRRLDDEVGQRLVRLLGRQPHDRVDILGHPHVPALRLVLSRLHNQDCTPSVRTSQADKAGGGAPPGRNGDAAQPQGALARYLCPVVTST
jgi:hypothetical protein